MIDTGDLAKAIAEGNKNKGSYCIRFTEGEVKGRYMGFGWNKTLARKSKSLYTTICSTHEQWELHVRHTPYSKLAFEIITIKEPKTTEEL